MMNLNYFDDSNDRPSSEKIDVMFYRVDQVSTDEVRPM